MKNRMPGLRFSPRESSRTKLGREKPINRKHRILHVKDLKTYFYGTEGITKAVDGISYEINEGEIVGLVGESGCGKSVSALSLLRLIPNPPGRIAGGEIIFESVDLLRISEKQMRALRGNKIAMIFQEPMTSLNPSLTIGRQISEALELHQNMSKKAAWRESIRLLELVRLPNAEQRADDYPHQLSGGMRQRVMIAMALSCKPRLLIADEPTTALDVTIQAQLLEELKGLTTRFGTAVLLITHNLGIIARYAQRVNVMYAGRIVEAAKVEDLYTAPRHPYTIQLIASVPRLDRSDRTKLSTIEGAPPPLFNLPRGCAFHPRCSYAINKCREERPKFLSVGRDHYVACWVDMEKGK